MGQIGRIIAESASLSPLYAKRLLEGVKAEHFARLASPGGECVQSNHAAFIFGHLSLYPSRALAVLECDAGGSKVPDGWEELFRPGAECRDDPDGSIYPPMERLTAFFFDASALAHNAVAEADDAALTAANPAEGRMREIFPTVGAMLGFYLGGHVQMHLGQMSAWRRAMGLPPA